MAIGKRSLLPRSMLTMALIVCLAIVGSGLAVKPCAAGQDSPVKASAGGGAIRQDAAEDGPPAAVPSAKEVSVAPSAELVAPAETMSAEDEARLQRQRAAERATAEAFGLLYARMDSLQVSAEQSVGELLADRPQLRAMLYDQLRRRARRSEAQFYSNGSVVVQIRLPMHEAVASLEQAVERLRPVQNDLPKVADFQQILVYTNRQAIWGYGREPLVAHGSPIDNPPPGWEHISVFNRLQSRRQAIDSAYSQLLVQMRTLRLSPSRRVSQFLDADARVATGVRLFINSYPTTGPVDYLPERLCQATVEIPVAHLVDELKALSVAYDLSDEYPADRFINIRADLHETVLRATGVAVPTAAAPGAAAIDEKVMVASAKVAVSDEVPDADQARLLAEQSALSVIVEGLRNKILELPIPGSDMQLEDYILKNSAAADDVDKLLANVRLTESDRSAAELVSVTGEIPIQHLDDLLEHYGRQNLAARDDGQ